MCLPPFYMQGVRNMEKYIINGNHMLSGDLTVQGSKNSALPILAATLLTNGTSTLCNVPELTDIQAEIRIAGLLGCRISFSNHTLTVDTAAVHPCPIPQELMGALRSSVIFLGAMLARFGEASVSFPGGCGIGSRPIDYHLALLEEMGAVVECENGERLHCTAPDGLHGADITLPYPSVGATENALLAAVTAKGKTVIDNAAREPEIEDLARYLNRCGARIHGAGERTVIVEGVASLSGCTHTVIPDRIMALTYAAAAAVTGGSALLRGVNPLHLSPVLPYLEKAGCRIRTGSDSLFIKAPRRLQSMGVIRTGPYPAFPTDCQPLFMAVSAVAHGVTVVTERVFENRFLHVDAMRRFGAAIETENNAVAIIEGVNRLYGARAEAPDLRGGAALVLMALAAEGQSTVSGLHHIDRGCENFQQSLTALGADITRA